MVSTRAMSSTVSTRKSHYPLTDQEDQSSNEAEGSSPITILPRRLAPQTPRSSLKGANPKRRRLHDDDFGFARLDLEDQMTDEGLHARFNAQPVSSVIESSPAQAAGKRSMDVTPDHDTTVDGQNRGAGSVISQHSSPYYLATMKELPARPHRTIRPPPDPYGVPDSDEGDRPSQASQDSLAAEGEGEDQDTLIHHTRQSAERNTPDFHPATQADEGMEDEADEDEDGEYEDEAEENEESQRSMRTNASSALVRVRADGLGTMLRAMGGPQWTNAGLSWASNFDTADSLEDWVKPFARGLPVDLKALLTYSRLLMRLFSKAPSLSDPDPTAQKAYFATSKVTRTLQKSTKLIETIVQDVYKQSAKYSRLAEAFAQRLIPLQLLVLKYAFTMGGWQQTTTAEKQKDPQHKPDEAKIPRNILPHLIQMVTSTKCLQEVIMRHAKPGSRVAKSWGLVRRHMDGLGSSISLAVEKCEAQEAEEHEEARIQLLTEKDNRAKLEREARERKAWESHDRQMELFIASTQRMGRPSSALLPTPGRRSRLVVTTVTQRPAPDPTTGSRKRSSGQVYEEENWGWSWDEDNTLMTMLRRVQNPSMATLKSLIPSKSGSEIKSRTLELKNKSRAFYEDLGVLPPPWCEAYEH